MWIHIISTILDPQKYYHQAQPFFVQINKYQDTYGHKKAQKADELFFITKLKSSM